VARITGRKGLCVKCRKRFTATKSCGIQAIAENLLGRQFCPIRSDLVWVGGITSIDTSIGRAFRNCLNSSLVAEALDRAFGSRSLNLDALVIHTDRGSMYIGKEHQQYLTDKKSRAAYP
jgi:transposase InsO family protein